MTASTLTEARAAVRATGRKAGIIRGQLRVEVTPPGQPPQSVFLVRSGRWKHGRRWYPLDGGKAGLDAFLGWLDAVERKPCAKEGDR